MARLGHSSTRAALIYQHATRDRDQAIATALGGLVQQVRATAANGRKRPAVTCSSRQLWPVCGPAPADRAVPYHRDNLLGAGGLGLHVGAGEGNRTLMTSLEGCDCHVAVQAKAR
jgi:hypothetical protein